MFCFRARSRTEVVVEGADFRKLFVAYLLEAFLTVNQWITARPWVSYSMVEDVLFWRYWLILLGIRLRSIVGFSIKKLRRRWVYFYFFIPPPTSATLWMALRKFSIGPSVMLGIERALQWFSIIASSWDCIRRLLQRMSDTVIRFSNCVLCNA